ncbi:MAG: biotin--[acetyl-CoA-carboxylase] ligase, partial [Vulcanimicrobiaceae bacterium]
MSLAGAFAAAVSAARLRYFTQIDHRVATGSTNEDAQKVLGDPASAGRVIVADEQTAGRGRRGRQWIAPPRSGLLFTAVLPQPIRAGDAWAVTFWTGICVAKALQRWNVTPQLQWPNDLLVDGRKMCGILCVSRIVGERASIACGVGLNVHRPDDRPDLDAIVPPPIFLDDCAAAGENARAELLAAILSEFEAALD